MRQIEDKAAPDTLVEELTEVGVELKDPGIGLTDFHADLAATRCCSAGSWASTRSNTGTTWSAASRAARPWRGTSSSVHMARRLRRVPRQAGQARGYTDIHFFWPPTPDDPNSSTLPGISRTMYCLSWSAASRWDMASILAAIAKSRFPTP